MNTEEKLGLAPCWVADALTTRYGRTIVHRDGVYVCARCGEVPEDCGCGTSTER